MGGAGDYLTLSCPIILTEVQEIGIGHVATTGHVLYIWGTGHSTSGIRVREMRRMHFPLSHHRRPS